MVEALEWAESGYLVNGPSAPLRPWVIVRGLLRTVFTAAAMVALYYVVPLKSRSTADVVVELAIGVTLLTGMIAWQVRSIIGSDHPGIRATHALATTTPLFLLLFAAAYVILSRNDPHTFTEPLSRSDSLYFTVTVFTTVGFGDITPRGDLARLLVAAQMVLDLVVLGVGARLILGAVQRGRAAHAAAGVGSGEGGDSAAG